MKLEIETEKGGLNAVARYGRTSASLTLRGGTIRGLLAEVCDGLVGDSPAAEKLRQQATREAGSSENAEVPTPALEPEPEPDALPTAMAWPSLDDESEPDAEEEGMENALDEG